MRRPLKKKLETVVDQRYLEKGYVQSLTTLFGVPKGADDISFVLDGMESGLNVALWAPWFSLPTSSSLERIIEPWIFMGDADVGKMFLNLFMDKTIYPFSGVYLTPFLGKEWDLEVHWYHWGRCGFGF
jgi:hypothetical protein